MMYSALHGQAIELLPVSIHESDAHTIFGDLKFKQGKTQWLAYFCKPKGDVVVLHVKQSLQTCCFVVLILVTGYRAAVPG